MTPPRFSREPIVLASGSASRRTMLEAAGIAIVVDKPDVDETALKHRFQAAGLTTEQAAMELALAKAEDVAGRHPGQIVLGGDQMLDCGGVWFDKPADMNAAAHHLATLSGRTHRLVSSAVAVQDGVVLWQATDEAQLTMRSLSSDFIATYLDIAGDRILSSVGGYQVECVGIQLFDRIQGSHFTILGLPLLPLLAFLRGQGVLDG